MSFFLSKLLPLFIYPLGLAILLALLAALAAWRGHRGGAAGLALLGVLVLWIPATPVFSDFILDTLENRYPPLPVTALPEAGAIVVLGGNIAESGKRRETLDLDAAFDRLQHGLALYRAGRAPVLVVSGGGAPGRVTEADVMAELLREYGVPDAAIVRETTSRNTRENGVNTAAFLKERAITRVILVTSAFHMERALAVFRRLGIETVPAATDYRADLRPAEMPLLEWLPHAETLYASTLAVREYLGMEVYRYRRWVE